MGLLRGLRQFLSKFDSFSASQYLRYKGQAEYTTAAGGFASLTITVLFLLLFVNTGMDTLNRVNVTSTYQTQVQNDPQEVAFTAGPANGFMFAVEVKQLTYSYGDTSQLDVYFYDQDSFNQTQLQPCTAEHFAFNDQISEYYDKYMTTKRLKGLIIQHNWLCIPLNTTLSLAGVETSDINKYFGIQIDQWIDFNSTTTPPRYSVKSVIVSTTINPYDTSNYISYYLEPLDSLTIHQAYSVKVGIQVEEYSVQTDTSILPISNILNQDGILSNTQAIKTIMTPTPASQTILTLATIQFTKGKTITTYTRAYQRIDDFFAYVGGLIGTVIGLFFIMGSYSELCYLISLGHKIYVYEKQQPIDSDKFNFFTFLLMKVVGIFSCFKCLNLEQKCSLAKRYADTEEQMTQQLDIGYLLKRISLLERAMTLIIDDDQFELLHMSQKLTLQQAKSQRNRFHLVQKVKKNIYQENKGKEDSEEYKKIKNKGKEKNQNKMRQETDEDLKQSSYKQEQKHFYKSKLKESSEKQEQNNSYHPDLSQSSFSTMKAESLHALKNKIKQSAHLKESDPKSNKILNNISSHFIDYLKKPGKLRNQSAYGSRQMNQFLGDSYFQGMQSKQMGSSNIPWQKYLEKKKENDNL